MVLEKNVFVKIQCDALTGDSLEELVWNHQAAKFNIKHIRGHSRKNKNPSDFTSGMGPACESRKVLRACVLSRTLKMMDRRMGFLRNYCRVTKYTFPVLKTFTLIIACAP
jgi:hypothetical protein